MILVLICCAPFVLLFVFKVASEFRCWECGRFFIGAPVKGRCPECERKNDERHAAAIKVDAALAVEKLEYEKKRMEKIAAMTELERKEFYHQELLDRIDDCSNIGGAPWPL